MSDPFDDPFAPTPATPVGHALEDPRSGGTPAHGRKARQGGRHANKGGSSPIGWIPLAQVAAILSAIYVLVMFPAQMAIMAWLLGAFLVPVLWAVFYGADKRRQFEAGRKERARGVARLNQWLFGIGLLVGLYGGYVFAMEIAK